MGDCIVRDSVLEKQTYSFSLITDTQFATMEKIKNMLKPGKSQDDEALYGTEQSTKHTGGLTGEGSHLGGTSNTSNTTNPISTSGQHDAGVGNTSTSLGGQHVPGSTGLGTTSQTNQTGHHSGQGSHLAGATSSGPTHTTGVTTTTTTHIAGLLAYYLSLQPASDSEYAVAEITPKKLKESIISIATEGALSDVPSDTKNVLAWNGGGSSNYSSIIKAGGYTVKNTKPAKLPTTVELLEEAIENDFEVISGEVVKDTKAALSKTEKISKKIQKMIDAELHEFLEEMSS